MRCPKCRKEISVLRKVCSFCNYVFNNDIFNKLSFYLDLKNQFEKLRSLKRGFHEELEILDDKIRQYEKILNVDLKNLAANLPEEIEQDIPKRVEQRVELPQDTNVQKETVRKRQPEEIKETTSSNAEIRFGQKWLLIIGIVLTIFGIGYFLKYSFDKGWVGPAGRVAMAYLFGIGFLFAGNKFIQKNFNKLGLYLYGGGIAVLYSSTFAAFQRYHLFNQVLSISLMILITMLASGLSVFYDTKWLAVLGLIGGFLTPILLSTGQDNQVALMLYMVILNSGLLIIAFQKKWELLNILGFMFTYILFSLWYADYCLDKFWTTIIFLNIFYLMYIIIPFAYQLIKTTSEKMNGFYIMILNSFFAFGYGYFMIKQRFAIEWVSVITILYSIIFLSMANYLYKKNMHHIEGFILLISKSIFFLIITVPIMFSQHWITIFWMAQVIVLFWIGIRLNRHILVKGSYVLFGITLYKFLFYDYSSIFKLRTYGWFIKPTYGYMIVERYVTSFFLLAGIYIFARMVRKIADQYLTKGLSWVLSEKSSIKDSSIIYATWGALVFIVLNIETATFFHDYLLGARFAAISVLWTFFSVILMVEGLKNNNSILRKTSLVLFVITIIKVFFLDMSHISTPYRIISFVILGLVLIQVSYLYHRYKDKIFPAISGGGREGKK